MKKITIQKNKRKPFLAVQSPIIIIRGRDVVIEKEFIFTESCLYKINNDVPTFLNKLFGFSPSIGLRAHHHNSWRFAWKPSWNLKGIDIFNYYYENGILKTNFIKTVELHKKYKYRLSYEWDSKVLRWEIIDADRSYISEISVELDFILSIGYTLGLYFGGKPKAPHKIVIWKKNNRV